MQGDWSHEIQRDYLGKDVRFTFPIRKLGVFRFFGLLPIGFGVLFIWLPGKCSWEFIRKWHDQGADIGNVLFSIFPLLFVFAGCLPAAIGFAILFGRTRIEWKDGQLRSTEMVGPFRWTRRLPAKPIRRLAVSAASQSTGNSPPREMPNFSGLVAEFEDGSKKMIAFGYPKDWLLAVAGELKSYVGGSLEAAKVEVVEAPLNPNEEDFPEQPAGSRIKIAEQANGVRLTIPPAGLWRGSKGMFAFSVIWCGFMSVFTTVMFLPGTKVEGSRTVMILFVLAFWLIGFGLLAISINMAKRTATLSVSGGQLEVEVKSLFGTKQRKWTRAEIAAIRADNSGMEVNDRPVLQLQVHPVGGKKVGLLNGIADDELRWIATQLRRALNVPARKAD